MKEETLFYAIGEKLEGAVKSQMFGKPCFKIGGKAFISFLDNAAMFKVTGETHSDVLGLSGSRLFDPSGKDRPWKQWVQVSFEHSDKWADYANAAAEYVGGVEK